MSTITLHINEPISDGKIFTFRAPCNCTGVTGVVIDGVEYALVNAMSEPISEQGNVFRSGSLISTIVDTTNKKLFLLNGARGETLCVGDIKVTGADMSSNEKYLPCDGRFLKSEDYPDIQALKISKNMFNTKLEYPMKFAADFDNSPLTKILYFDGKYIYCRHYSYNSGVGATFTIVCADEIGKNETILLDVKPSDNSTSTEEHSFADIKIVNGYLCIFTAKYIDFNYYEYKFYYTNDLSKGLSVKTMSTYGLATLKYGGGYYFYSYSDRYSNDYICYSSTISGDYTQYRLSSQNDSEGCSDVHYDEKNKVFWYVSTKVKGIKYCSTPGGTYSSVSNTIPTIYEAIMGNYINPRIQYNNGTWIFVDKYYSNSKYEWHIWKTTNVLGEWNLIEESNMPINFDLTETTDNTNNRRNTFVIQPVGNYFVICYNYENGQYAEVGHSVIYLTKDFINYEQYRIEELDGKFVGAKQLFAMTDEYGDHLMIVVCKGFDVSTYGNYQLDHILIAGNVLPLVDNGYIKVK